MTVSELLQLSALLELDPGQLLAEAETKAQSDLDADIPLPDDWEVTLAARRVADSPEAREAAFLDSLGEESQE